MTSAPSPTHEVSIKHKLVEKFLYKFMASSIIVNFARLKYKSGITGPFRFVNRKLQTNVATELAQQMHAFVKMTQDCLREINYCTSFLCSKMQYFKELLVLQNEIFSNINTGKMLRHETSGQNLHQFPAG